MTNPFRSQRERAAYEAGLAAGRAEGPDAPTKVLSREQVQAMSTAEMNRRWPEVQASLKAGLPTQDQLETQS
jgi:hypothetical protein